MMPFSISEISRAKVEYETGYVRWRWTIGVNWPNGEITFEGEGFRQELRADPIITSSQWLQVNQRSGR